MPPKKKKQLRTMAIFDETKVAIYIRVSTHYQVDRESLPMQRSDLINYCKLMLSTDSYEVFEDAGYSAKNFERPDFQSMMRRVRMGEFSHILVWKIDRISRNLLDFAGMYAELKDLGVTFVSKNEQFDTSTAIGEAMLKIILIFAELERNMTSERVTATMMSRAAEGKWNGGRVPHGYNYDKETKTFSIDPEQSEAIRLMYSLYMEHRSLLAVSKELNRRGYTTRRGNPWNPVTIQTVLRNPFYYGTMRYNYRCEHTKDWSLRPESDWVVIDDHHPAIVSKDLWDEVGAILSSQARGQPGSGRSYNRGNVHIFAGLTTCGYCGNLMTATKDRARKNGWRPSIYLCAEKRRTQDCPNKYVSDITIGPFVLNYIANVIRAQNSFGVSTSIEALEKKLLRGEAMAEVASISRPGLDALYQQFRASVGKGDEFFSNPHIDTSDSATEREVLLSERKRYERALDRLKALYLYGDKETGIGEAEYFSERKVLTDKLEDIVHQIGKLDTSLHAANNLSDDEFIARASHFIMAQQLSNKRQINYTRFIQTVDAQIVKNFINSVCSNFCIKNGRIVSIRFKNGIEHQFSYKDEE